MQQRPKPFTLVLRMIPSYASLQICQSPHDHVIAASQRCGGFRVLVVLNHVRQPDLFARVSDHVTAVFKLSLSLSLSRSLSLSLCLFFHAAKGKQVLAPCPPCALPRTGIAGGVLSLSLCSLTVFRRHSEPGQENSKLVTELFQRRSVNKVNLSGHCQI